MKGIDKIQEFLGEFKSNYVIIGGTAANLNLELHGQKGRVTKDIDMIVVCEAINSAYVERSLLVLKAKAYLNNRQRKLDGAQVQSDDINKYKKDIYRLSFIINEGDLFEVPSSIASDLNRFCELLIEEPVNAQALSKYMAAPEKTMGQIVEQIKLVFSL